MPNESENKDVPQAVEDKSNPPVDINALIVKLPAFWSSNPKIWFVQAEAQFALGKITADLSKYNYVVATLPQDVAETVVDILENPPTTGMYNSLKETLIDRHSLSIESRIRKLVSDEEIGDKKPSDYFRKLQQLAGNNSAIGSELLKELWIGRLPQAVSVALIPQKDEDVKVLTKLADRVWEAIKTANISAVSANSSTSKDDLKTEISELRMMIEKLSYDRSQGGSGSQYRSRSPNENNSRSRSRNRSRSRGPRFNPKGRFCYDHFMYRSRAAKCTQPCSFNSAQPSSGQNNPN